MNQASTLVERSDSDGGATIVGHGAWVIDQARALTDALSAVHPRQAGRVRFDLSGLDRLDTTGAWLLENCRRRLRDEGTEVAVEGLSEERRLLVDQVSESADAVPETLEIPRRERPSAGSRLLRAATAPGRAIVDEGASFLTFLGFVTLALLRVPLGRARVPGVSILHHMQQVWINALPIVGVLTFVVGGAVTFMGGSQLKQFQAEVYAIDLIGLAMLREVGIIITAIVVAGRSGSAFVVEIGTMKTRQEVDAMRATGIDPIEALVLPRLIAIVITMPFLGLFGDIMGLIGGGAAAITGIGVTPELFMTRLSRVTELEMFAAGIVKTPVLAAIIGLVGCWQGMRVEGGVERLGRLTTRAVVQALFLVLAVDSLFSVFLSVVGL